MTEEKIDDMVETKAPGVLSIDDVADQYDPNTTVQMERAAQNPFAGYPIKIIEARYYPRDPQLDAMSLNDLLQYCTRNELFHREWIVQRGLLPNSKDQHERVIGIKTDWKKEKILQYIDRRQTHRFPSHHLVFCNLPPTKPGLPRIFPVKSWITRRFRSVWFDLAWPLPTPEDPYRIGDPFKCAIVDDDSMRAQMFFMREPRTGKVVMRTMTKGVPTYHLLAGDGPISLPILRRIFTNGTKGSADLQLWGKEFGGIPDLD